MNAMEVIYQALLSAKDLETSVKLLTDDELRCVLAHLDTAEESAWPARVVQGVCTVNAASRFVAQTGGVL